MRRGGKTRLLHRMEDSGKRAWKSSGLRSSSEREVMEAVENYLERGADIKVDIEGLGALDRARRRRGSPKVHPEVLDERRQQYFPAL